jgi:hypothetical protein
MYAEEPNAKRKLDLFHYWSFLQDFGYNPADVYVEMVEGREPNILEVNTNNHLTPSSHICHFCVLNGCIYSTGTFFPKFCRLKNSLGPGILNNFGPSIIYHSKDLFLDYRAYAAI